MEDCVSAAAWAGLKACAMARSRACSRAWLVAERRMASFSRARSAALRWNTLGRAPSLSMHDDIATAARPVPFQGKVWVQGDRLGDPLGTGIRRDGHRHGALDLDPCPPPRCDRGSAAVVGDADTGTGADPVRERSTAPTAASSRWTTDWSQPWARIGATGSLGRHVTAAVAVSAVAAGVARLSGNVIASPTASPVAIG
jgi:hypothetical protein